jgi:hypothetical protein
MSVIAPKDLILTDNLQRRNIVKVYQLKNNFSITVTTQYEMSSHAPSPGSRVPAPFEALFL